MTFEDIKEWLDESNSKEEKLRTIKMFIYRIESKRDLYKALDYINYEKNYEKFIENHDYRPYMPPVSILISSTLEKRDKRFEAITIRQGNNKKDLTMVNVASKDDTTDTRKAFSCSTVEIRYNKNSVSIMKPYDGKYLGDNYFCEDKILIDEEISYSGNVAEKIFSFISEKYFGGING